MQFNKLLSILLSILITKVIFIELIIFFIPYIGLSAQTKPIVYFMSITIIYFVLRFVFNFIQSNLENLHKNKLIDSTLGSFKINDNTTERLKKSALFNSIFITKTVLVDYGE